MLFWFVFLIYTDVNVVVLVLVSMSLSGLPRFLSQPEGVSVRVGGTEMLNCEVTEELAPFTRWEKSGGAVDVDSRVTQLSGGALVISNASQSDAGLYRCIIDGVGAAKTSEEAELQVSSGKGSSSLSAAVFSVTLDCQTMLQTPLLKKDWRSSRVRSPWRRLSGRTCCCHAL